MSTQCTLGSAPFLMENLLVNFFVHPSCWVAEFSYLLDKMYKHFSDLHSNSALAGVPFHTHTCNHASPRLTL